MSKYLRLIVVSLTLALFCVGTVVAAQPLVEYIGFDPGTFTYTYQVTQGSDVEFSFAELEIDAFVGSAWPYTIHDPIESFPFGPWAKNQSWWSEPTYVDYKWVGSVPPGIYLPSMGLSSWVGTFNLTVPNTQPVMGDVIARSSDYGAPIWMYDLPVPGPVPEPSGVLVLATGAFGFMATIRRRK